MRTEFLAPSESAAGDGFRVNHDVRAGDVTVAEGAQLFSGPRSPLDVLDGHWTFAWETGLTWLEEATEVHVHARDTRKRVDTVPSERHVVVEIDGEVVAESRRPLALFETDLPVRWYLPLEDVRQDVLVPSDLVTHCPYKGAASYWSVQTAKRLHRSIAWYYADPIPENPRIKGLVSFFNERVDLIVDGERVDRPRTPFSL